MKTNKQKRLLAFWPQERREHSRQSKSLKLRQEGRNVCISVRSEIPLNRAWGVCRGILAVETGRYCKDLSVKIIVYDSISIWEQIKASEQKNKINGTVKMTLYWMIQIKDHGNGVLLLHLWWLILRVSLTGLRDVQIAGKTSFLGVSAKVFLEEIASVWIGRLSIDNSPTPM